MAYKAPMTGPVYVATSSKPVSGARVASWIAAIVVAACVVIFHVQVTALLAALFLGGWPTFADVVSTMLAGAIGGALIGVLRFVLKRDSGVVNELIATAASPDTVTAAGLGMAAVGFQLLLGVVSGLVAAHVGLTAVGIDPHSALAFIIAGSGGPPDAGGGSLWGALVALTVLIIVITIIASMGLAVLGVVLSKSLITGATGSSARALGELLALMLTRLWTTRLTSTARSAPPGPLSPADAIERYVTSHSDPQTREIDRLRLQGFYRWLASSDNPEQPGQIKTALERYVESLPQWRDYQARLAAFNAMPKYKRYSPEWVAHHDDRRRLRELNDIAFAEKQALESYVDALARMEEARNPKLRMVEPTGTPIYDGSNTTLINPGIMASAIKSSIVSGAYGGIVSAIIACFVLTAVAASGNVAH